MRRVRRPLILAAILAVIVGSLYLGLLVRWPVERPLVYWSIDDSTLGILVGDAPHLGCGVAFVDESSDGVRVHAQCFEHVIPVPQLGMLQPYVMEVTLAAPLGNRPVFDGAGNPGQLCPGPWQESRCSIPG